MLEAQIQGDRPGTYGACAELRGADRPIAFARRRSPTWRRARTRWRCRSAVKMIQQSGLDGPYRVRNVRLKQVDTRPAHEPAPIAELPPTAPYRAAELR